jgi:hypothetical protein
MKPTHSDTFGNNPAADIELMRRVMHGKVSERPDMMPTVLVAILASVLCAFAAFAFVRAFF